MGSCETNQAILNGVKVIPSWLETFRAAQGIRKISIGGEIHDRLRYGEESIDGWKASVKSCQSCAAAQGNYHVPDCDGEECPLCFTHLHTCTCKAKKFIENQSS